MSDLNWMDAARGSKSRYLLNFTCIHSCSHFDGTEFAIAGAHHCSIRAIKCRLSVEHSRRRHVPCTRCNPAHRFPPGKHASVAPLQCRTSPWPQLRGASSGALLCNSLALRIQSASACTAVCMGGVLRAAMSCILVPFQAAHQIQSSAMETDQKLHVSACGSHTHHHQHTLHRQCPHCQTSKHASKPQSRRAAFLASRGHTFLQSTCVLSASQRLRMCCSTAVCKDVSRPWHVFDSCHE